MAVKWLENQDSTGFKWYKSGCDKYSCFKEKYVSMTEDGEVLEHTHQVMMMNGRGYMGRWGILGIFNTGKEAMAFVNDCENSQQWPETHVDTREHLEGLRRYVKYFGDIAIAKRKAEEAERKAREEAEELVRAQRRQAEAEEKARQEELEQKQRLEAEKKAAEDLERQAAERQAAKEAEKAAKAEAARAAKEAKASARKPRKAKVEAEEAAQESLFA